VGQFIYRSNASNIRALYNKYQSIKQIEQLSDDVVSSNTVTSFKAKLDLVIKNDCGFI
jgi:uncharacterized protein YbaA (DUF1428 family)